MAVIYNQISRVLFLVAILQIAKCKFLTFEVNFRCFCAISTWVEVHDTTLLAFDPKSNIFSSLPQTWLLLQQKVTSRNVVQNCSFFVIWISSSLTFQAYQKLNDLASWQTFVTVVFVYKENIFCFWKVAIVFYTKNCIFITKCDVTLKMYTHKECFTKVELTSTCFSYNFSKTIIMFG